MTGGSREPLLGGGHRYDGPGQFREALEDLLARPDVQHVPLPALAGFGCSRAWLLPLADGSKVFVFEELITDESFACDCCRIMGWQTHPVGNTNWHFIVPAEEGQYSLADPTTLCAITEARSRGLEGSARIALPAADPDAPHHYQAATIFESKMHRLHGTVHSNGFGHLMRLNGREGGSKRASGRQLMQLWDDLCEALRVREISTEDVSNKAGMELRVLHAAARRMTWYGQWHYGFGRGGFNMQPQKWHAAIEYVHGASVDDVLADFDGIDATVMDILQRYRDPTSGGSETLGALLSRMLGLLSHPDPILPVFEAAAAAERERQRMIAEQRMLMQAYHEQQRALAAQQAQRPLFLGNGPTAAYFDVSAQQQELARQQQEFFALACQPVPGMAPAAAPMPTEQPAAAPAVVPALPAAAAQPQQQQRQQEQQVSAAEPSSEATATDPEGEAAAPSGEPEMRFAAAAEAAAAEAADEAAAAAHSIAQAAFAAAIRAADHPPAPPPLLWPQAAPAAPQPAPAAPAVPQPEPAAPSEQPAQQQQQQQEQQQQELPAAPPADALPLSAPPQPPLPESAAADAADEANQWLADYASEGEEGGSGAAEGEGPVEGTLHCRRAAGLGNPPLADVVEPAAAVAGLPAAAAAPAAAPLEAAGPGADGGVLRLRGGGSRKRAADDAPSDASDAKRQKAEGGGDGGNGGGRGGTAFGPELVGRSLMVYWKEEKTYYTGTITAYKDGKHTVHYRDGDVETLVLANERFKWSEKASVHVPDGKAAGAARHGKSAAAGKAGGRKDKGERRAEQGGGQEAPAAAKRGKSAAPEAAEAAAEEPAGSKKDGKRLAGKGATAAAAAAAGTAAAAAAAAGTAAEAEQQEGRGDKEGEARKGMDPARKGLGPSLMNVEMRIWFPQERRWKKGHSTSYARKRHSMLFEDGSRAAIDLLDVKFEILDKASLLVVCVVSSVCLSFVVGQLDVKV